MASQTLTNVEILADGSVTAHFADADDRSYASRAAIIAEADELIDTNLLKKLLIARWAGLDPALTDPSKINGMTLESNMASVLNPLEYGVQ